MSLTVAVAGASGYAGGELIRLISQHPKFELRTVTAHSNAGQLLTRAHPQLRGVPELTLVETTAETLAGHDVVFLALPHGKSGELTAQLGDDTLLIDCGADHRLRSADDWQAFYGTDYHGAWPYGLPELPFAAGRRQREMLVESSRIAVPGCNATAVTLAFAPGLNAGVIEPSDLVAALAVGVSGAGKTLSPNLLASEILGSASAYQVGGVHRHIPEIRQNLAAAGDSEVKLSFTPVLVPMTRGILATCTARITPGTTAAEVRAAWQQAYCDEYFVRLLPEGEFPRTSDVVGSNAAQLGVAVDAAAGRAVIICAIDNLGKGTAGAAIQSANISLGLPEGLGLSVNGVTP